MRAKVRRKNKKIKFIADDYIEKFYMRDGKAIIPVELDDINDLYMKHDYKKLELSDDVCAYIDEIAYMFPVDTDIVIEIHCHKIDEETQERATKAIKNNYGIEISDIEYDIEQLNRRSFFLVLFGVILFGINYLCRQYMSDMISEFFSVIWWIGIWDAIEMQILDRTNNKWKRLNYQQLYESEVKFVFDKGFLGL